MVLQQSWGHRARDSTSTHPVWGDSLCPPCAAQVSRLGVGAEPSLGSLWHLPHRGDGSFVGPESADASMVSLGSLLTTSSSTAATQRLSDSVSSRFGHWRGFKVRQPSLKASCRGCWCAC